MTTERPAGLRLMVEFIWPGTAAGDGRPVRELVYIDDDDHSVRSAIEAAEEKRRRIAPDDFVAAVPTGVVKVVL